VFTVDEARELLASVRPRFADLLRRRADLAELRADIEAGRPSSYGGLPEAKALEALVYADLEAIAATGAEVKGWAPLLLDYPGSHDGVPVMWCWLEGDADIEWYHRNECGFAGRRRI
jgi:hypothetical protein